MKSYIAILRGINVSGKNLIKMEDLKELLKRLQYTDINTYIQSGNIGFKTKKQATHSISKKITNAINEQWGYNVQVIVFEKSYLETLIKNNPFLKRKGIDESLLHVTFLNANPDANAVKSMDATTFKPDEYSVGDQAIYIYTAGGYGNTKLSNLFFEKKLKLNATTRNWKTVNALLELVHE